MQVKDAIQEWNNQIAEETLGRVREELDEQIQKRKIVNGGKFAALTTLTMGVGLIFASAQTKQFKKELQPLKWDAFRKYRELRKQYFLAHGFEEPPEIAKDHTLGGNNPFL